MLGNLVNRHREGPAQLQEGSDRPQGQAAEACDSHGASEHSDQSILQESQISQDRHQDVRIDVCVRRALAQLIVEFVETLLGFCFAAEDFHFFLAMHHLFDIAVHFTESLLLFDEVDGTLAADRLRDGDRQGHHQDNDERQRQADCEHRGEYADDRDQGGKGHRDTLRKHLAQSIDIICVAAHDIPVRMRVEILDRQGLHMREQLITDFFLDPLGNGNHQDVVDISRHDPDHVNACHHRKCAVHAGEDRVGYAQ